VSDTVYYAAATLDGYIAEADDTLEWLTEYAGSYSGKDAAPMKGSYDQFYESIGSLVMGSATYEFVLDHMSEWPYAGKRSWILTSRELPRPEGAGDDDLVIGPGEVTELHGEMLDAAGDGDLWVVGGGNVASQFADAGLIDELIVTVTPVILGTGKPLFDNRLPEETLQLEGTRAWDSGMVELRYSFKR
jgi:dihydrofolate reductase